MTTEKNKRVCPVENAGGLDNSIRRFLQNPRKILKPYVKPGMTILDLGCGPGVFSIEMGRMLENEGKVIAADLQPGMLLKVRNKIKDTELEQIIELHKCQEDKIGISEPVDFVLAFYMIHEVPDQQNLFREIQSILKPGGKMFIIEPKFHVSKKSFETMTGHLMNNGFEMVEKPKVFFSRTIVVKKM